MTASVTVSIARPGGTTVSATGQVPDELVADIAAMLGAMIFETAANPPAPAVQPGPDTSAPASATPPSGAMTTAAPV